MTRSHRREIVIGRRRHDALQRRLPVRVGDGFLGDLPRHVAVDGRKAGLDALLARDRCRRTLKPASEQTWAMPLPIWPAPITPTVLISILIVPSPRSALVMKTDPVGDAVQDVHIPDPIDPALVNSSSSSGQDREEVADEAVIGDLEDRRFLVLVDRDDDLGILHAGEMLDGARDADRDVELAAPRPCRSGRPASRWARSRHRPRRARRPRRRRACRRSARCTWRSSPPSRARGRPR